jgi:hypothetical protein
MKGGLRRQQKKIMTGGPGGGWLAGSPEPTKLYYSLSLKFN